MADQNLKQILQGTFIINVAMVLGPIFVAGFSYYLNNYLDDGKPFLGMAELKGPFQYVSLAVTLLAFVAGRYLMRNRLSTLKESNSLERKLGVYRSASILRTALLEGAALANLIFYLLTGWNGFLYLAGLLVIYMASNLPTANKISKELGLSTAEHNQLLEVKTA